MIKKILITLFDVIQPSWIIYYQIFDAQSAGVVEYTYSISAEW